MQITRRSFVQNSLTAAAAWTIAGCQITQQRPTSQRPTGEWVNDLHSQLNATRIAAIEQPRDLQSLQSLIQQAHRKREAVSLCGGRHAAGGQQFLTDRRLIDLSGMNRVLNFDQTTGTIEIESGARWPAILDHLHAPSRSHAWGVHQKQGGADELSLGGAIASNIHGRCLASRPIVQDIVAMKVVSPDGSIVFCDRNRDAALFRHVIGGYGLFGVVYSVTLKLERRRKLVRHVKFIPANDAVATLEARRDAGAWHGDFQFSVDPSSVEFCNMGLCSWYEPVADDTPSTVASHEDAAAEFSALIELAHQDKSRAMALYRDTVLAASGKAVEWSDAWQRGDYVPNYHRAIDAARGGRGSEILCEIHVPRAELPEFLAAAARILRDDHAELIYGVVRLIHRDDETFLAWAKQPFACVIFNVHTQLEPDAIAHNHATFRRLLDAALQRRGSYYLTYHRAARLNQLEQAYPEFRDFLAQKRRYDPRGTLQSDWYRHYQQLFA